MRREFRRGTWSWKAMVAMLALSSLAVFIIILLGTVVLRKEVRGVPMAQPKSGQRYTACYALVVEDSDDLFWQNVYRAAKEEAEKQNILVELSGAGLLKEYSVADKFKMALDAHVDGILVVPEGEDMEALLEEAAKKKVPVVTLLDDSRRGERQSFVGVSSEAIGKLYGQALREVDQEDKRVLILINAQDQVSSNNLICLSISEALTQLGYEVEVKPIDRRNAFSAEEIIRDIIINPSKIPGTLICLNTEDTLCAYQAVIDYNQVGNVKIMGYYQSDGILEGITKGIISTTLAIDTEAMGRRGVEALTSYREDQQVNAYFTVGVQMINEENVAQYKDASEKGE